jgi:hypothetical protein
MTRLRCEIRFKLDAEVWISRACCGQTVQFGRNNFDVEIRLPPFSPANLTFGNLNFEGFAGGASGKADEAEPRWLAVNELRIIIHEDFEGISQAELNGPRGTDVQKLIVNHQRQRMELAEQIAIEFLDWLRLSGQTWLGGIGEIAYRSQPHASTFEDETNFRFPFGHGGVLHAEVRPEDAMLDRSSLEGIGRQLSGVGTSRPLAESFLADSGHFVLRDTPANRQRAVIMAAIACELKVKETLRTKVFPGGETFVNVLIENPRDFSMSAPGLFHEAMQAAIGRSLKVEHRELYNRIDHDKRGLIQMRNQIVHVGFIPNQGEAMECVSAAREVFAWLEGLPRANTPLS